jgi:hypothetical protein
MRRDRVDRERKLLEQQKLENVVKKLQRKVLDPAAKGKKVKGRGILQGGIYCSRIAMAGTVKLAWWSGAIGVPNLLQMGTPET